MSSFWAFFRVLCIIQKRQYLWLLAELFLPLLFSSTLLALYYQVEIEKRADKTYDPFPVFGSALDLLTPVDGVPLSWLTRSYQTLYYSPQNLKTDALMQRIKNRFEWGNVLVDPLLDFYGVNGTALTSSRGLSVREFCARKMQFDKRRDRLYELCESVVMRFQLKVKGFKNESALVDYAIDVTTPNNYIGGIVFEELEETSIRYKLRFRFYHIHLLTSYFSGNLLQNWGLHRGVPDGLNPISRNAPNLSDGGVPAYWREEFLMIQRAVDLAFLEGHGQKSDNDFFLERFPYPADRHHPIHAYATLLVPLVLMVSFLLNILYVARNIGSDQETGIKEYLEAIGLGPSTYLSAYFLLNTVKLLFPVGILTAVIWIIFPSSNPSLIALFVLEYGLNAVAFGFAISSLIRTGTMSTLMSAIFWFALYLPTVFIQKHEADMSVPGRIACVFLLNPAAIAFLRILRISENRGSGLQWSGILESHGGVSVGIVFIALAIDGFVLLLVSGIFQTKWKFWQKPPPSKEPEYKPKFAFGTPESERKSTETKYFKVEIRNLSVLLRSGKSSTIAVKDVSFDAYDKNITVMLGQNGSGKTTILSVLAGIRRATEGTIMIGSHDGLADRKSVTELLGYCPQINPLFENLTVMEHLRFYAGLKGHEFDIKIAAERLERLRLWEKRHSLVRTLSGGMKRKLTLLVALSGNSKLVLLDEPTSGLDPEARKDVQSLLLEEKKERSIILTTHYLDEADLLGDQIVMLHRGKVLQKGTARLLKRTLGEYASLCVTFEENNLEDCIRETKTVIKAQIHDASIDLRQGKYLTAKLSTDRTTWHHLSKILHDLDVARMIFRIARMRISITSLDDVFKEQMKILERTEGTAQNSTTHRMETFVKLKLKSDATLTGPSRYFQTLDAMLLKKLKLIYRQPVLVLLQFLVPVISITLGVFVNALNHRYTPDPHPLLLNDLSDYSHSRAILLSKNNRYSGEISAYESDWGDILAGGGIDVLDVSSEDSLEEYLLDTARKQGAPTFLSKHFFGLESHETRTTGFFNPVAPHSIAAALALASNALAKSTLGGTAKIETVNDPLPPQFVVYFLYGDEFVLALSLSVGLLLFLSTLTILPTQERVTRSKHQQRLSGASALQYWHGHWAWDYFLSVLVNAGCVVVLVVGGVEFLVGGWSSFHLFLLLSLHSAALIPFSYLGSFLFSSGPGGTAKMAIINLVLGLCPTIGSAFLKAMSFEKKYEYLRTVEAKLADVLSALIPQFALTKALMQYYSNRLMEDQCNRLNIPCSSLGDGYSITSDYISWEAPGIGRQLAFLLIHSLLLMLLLIFSENLTFGYHSLCFWRKKRKARDDRVFHSRTGKGINTLETNQLSIRHCAQMKPAVDELTIRLHKGASMCLLGHNGAGKTTLFRALAGQLPLHHGQAFIGSADLNHSLTKAGQEMGYCPQFDALTDRLTVLENLYLFAKIRGVPAQDQRMLVDSLVFGLGLEEHATKLVKTLSGGNKRKTSMGVALMSLPPLLLLDEPTTGVDPQGRLDIATFLAHLVQTKDTSILMSSHSLDVIESACGEILVLEGGKVRCQGHLKDFANGHSSFFLRVTASSEKGATAADQMIRETFHSVSALRTPNSKERVYQVTRLSAATWPQLCKVMESIQDKERLTDFEISETFLDEFLGSQ